MQGVVDHEGSEGRAIGDWPLIAARELFEAMAANPAQPQADLVTQLAVTMLNMQHVGEMAILWTEVGNAPGSVSQYLCVQVVHACCQDNSEGQHIQHAPHVGKQ